jgi:hypothetical protein
LPNGRHRVVLRRIVGDDDLEILEWLRQDTSDTFTDKSRVIIRRDDD